MKFRTEIKMERQPDMISYQSEILSIGSCFADEIGNRLVQLQFPAMTNPYGIIFNPVSISNCLLNALTGKIKHSHCIERDGNYYHLDYHSSINSSTESGLLQKIAQLNSECSSRIKSSRILIITFGTAWVYRYNHSSDVIANCQKIPQKNFTKELLDLELLKKLYDDLFKQLQALNPELQIILTVSPVRHIKDGIHENNVSKSVLLLLTDYLVKRFEKVNYFPSYELIVDDLRDYRFYKEDLIHPTSQAIDYVFEKFSETYFSDETVLRMKENYKELVQNRHRNFSQKSD